METININPFSEITTLPYTITTGAIYPVTFSANSQNFYNWEKILKECPYEDLKKEFRKRNLKKLLEEKP